MSTWYQLCSTGQVGNNGRGKNTHHRHQGLCVGGLSGEAGEKRDEGGRKRDEEREARGRKESGGRSKGRKSQEGTEAVRHIISWCHTHQIRRWCADWRSSPFCFKGHKYWVQSQTQTIVATLHHHQLPPCSLSVSCIQDVVNSAMPAMCVTSLTSYLWMLLSLWIGKLSPLMVYLCCDTNHLCGKKWGLIHFLGSFFLSSPREGSQVWSKVWREIPIPLNVWVKLPACISSSDCIQRDKLSLQLFLSVRNGWIARETRGVAWELEKWLKCASLTASVWDLRAWGFRLVLGAVKSCDIGH